MYLMAFSVGCAVPITDFDASVHSVFQSAANLRLEKGGKLLTLVNSGEADLPQGIRLDTPAGLSFNGLLVGEPVTCRDDILRCSFLTIDLRGAGRWKCDLPSLQADMTNPSVAIAWRYVWQALNERQIQSDAEIISENLFRLDETIRVGVSRKAGEAIRILFEATRRFDLTAASSLETLIGLGPGLTPSGDDFLMGYMAGLWCAAKGRSERLNFISALGEIVIRLSKGTNDISRTYLYHAACGQVSSRLFNLANAICAGSDPQHVLDCAKSAMQIGHTSGMDAVTGLLFGLAAWDIFPL